MSSTVWVSAGVVLAVLVAWGIVMLFPEDRLNLGLENHEQIKFEILPRDANLANLERGRSYYIQLCSLCHGSDGSGNGEYSYRMVPKPSNLISKATMNKSTKHLSVIVRDGIVGTAMSGWGTVLNEAQRLQLVDYIRYLALRYEHTQS